METEGLIINREGWDIREGFGDGVCPCDENCQCGPECPCKGNNAEGDPGW